jgi:hypothetical protein
VADNNDKYVSLSVLNLSSCAQDDVTPHSRAAGSGEQKSLQELQEHNTAHNTGTKTIKLSTLQTATGTLF